MIKKEEPGSNVHLPSTPSKVSAVVVTFNPSRDVIDNVRSLREQVSNVVVIDNGSDLLPKKFVQELEGLENVTVVYRSTNGGIAVALNEGVRLARAKGAYWIATFDQDSRVGPSMVPHMLRAYESYSDKERVAILAPTYIDIEGGLIRNFFADAGPSGQDYDDVMTVMTSGNLVRSDVFDKVGPFNEEFFIDYVDHEFCLRCKSAGLAILQIRSATLSHGLGHKTSFNLFGRVISVTNHSPLRRYYITRNRMVTYKRFGRAYPAWVHADMVSFVKESIRIVIFEAFRLKKISAIAHGAFDAVLGKTGQLKAGNK